MSQASLHRFPDSPVFYRDLTRVYPLITHGKGCYLFDNKGRRYLDACGGAFVANLGHGVPEIAKALADQASQIAYVNGTAFTSSPLEELAAETLALCPEGLDKVFFLSSGSEAVEAAMKLSRQYWVESGRPGKHKIVSLRPSYHGNTLLALSASSRPHYQKLFKPWLIDMPQVPAPYAYRCDCAGSPDCPACSGSALEDVLRTEGPESVAAFIAEPVGGSSTGASVPREDYHAAIREICDRHDIHFIADEVLTGVGRTGAGTAIRHFNVTPDILTLGKGLSGGYAPLSAVAAKTEIAQVLAHGSGKISHAQTFMNAPLACAAGLAALRHLKKHGLIERSAVMGNKLHERLKELKNLPAVGDIRGLGLLAGIELVSDKNSRKPFPRDLKLAETLVAEAQEVGLILWPNTGHADGVSGDLVMIAPPFIISEDEIEELVSLFKKALSRTLKRLEVATSA